MDIISLPRLKLPVPKLKYRESNGKLHLYCIFRKKYVVITPEEWVRQSYLHNAIENLGFPQSLIRLEHTIKVADLHRRCDAVIYNKKGEVNAVCEFKSPKIRLDNKVLKQAGLYNTKLKVKHILISNGIGSFYIKGKDIKALIPEHSDLLSQ